MSKMGGVVILLANQVTLNKDKQSTAVMKAEDIIDGDFSVGQKLYHAYGSRFTTKNPGNPGEAVTTIGTIRSISEDRTTLSIYFNMETTCNPICWGNKDSEIKI